MKILYWAAIILLLSGCSAPYLDQEFGMATRESLDQQIVHTDNPHKGEIPVGIEGISAEELMNAYNSSFSKPAEPTKIFSLGFSGFAD
jgi:hypothetical protein